MIPTITPVSPFALLLCFVASCVAGCSFGLEEAAPGDDAGSSSGAATSGADDSPESSFSGADTPPSSTGSSTLPGSAGMSGSTSLDSGWSDSADSSDASDGFETSTTSDSSSTSGSPVDPPCAASSDCDLDEVCIVDEDLGSVCVDATRVPHALRVLSFDAPCNGIGLDEFYFQINNGLVSTKTPWQSECPLSWPNDWFIIAAGGPVTIDFYEESLQGEDTLIATWCWDDGFGCGLIPSELLHDGSATVGWDEWTAEFEFVAVE